MLFLKDGRKTEDIVADITRLDEDDEFEGIRCPHCAWRPSSHDRWCCQSNGGPEPPFRSCGTNWNTFSTKGRCPGCSHQWQWTLCLRCVEWSPHADWYERGSNPHD
jgi:hypothetical protein